MSSFSPSVFTRPTGYRVSMFLHLDPKLQVDLRGFGCEKGDGWTEEESPRPSFSRVLCTFPASDSVSQPPVCLGDH